MFCIYIDRCIYALCFFFSSRRRHTMSLCDWSSDVCSSDLASLEGGQGHVTFYVEVGDLEATLGKIEGLGGSGVVEPMDVPDGPRSRCSPTPRAILWASSRPDLDAAEPRGEPCKRPNNVDNETPLPEYAEK